MLKRPGAPVKLAAKLRAAPEVPLRPYSKRPEALAAAKRAMKRAGFDWAACILAPGLHLLSYIFTI